MEREKGESPFSPRARKLIRRACLLGIDPDHVKAEVQIARGLAQGRGRNRINRGDLRNLAEEVNSTLIKRRLERSGPSAPALP